MTRVLLTGMTATQTSVAYHSRSATFAGLMHDAFRLAGHEVFMMDPNVYWARSELMADYDLVLVGIAPVTGLPANRAYGALSVIDHLWGSNSARLAFYVDAPEPARIWASLRSIENRPENLTKPFFSARKGYELAVQPRVTERLLHACDLLLHVRWPKLVVPQLPWHSSDRLLNQLPEGSLRDAIFANLDPFLHISAEVATSSERRWMHERAHPVWLRSQEGSLTMPIMDITEVARRKAPDGGDEAVMREMAGSHGTLISPWRDGTWWTPRIWQSLSMDTPVATDWHESSVLGAPWSTLATSIEGLSRAEAAELAIEQRRVYRLTIGNSAQRLLNELGIGRTSERATHDAFH